MDSVATIDPRHITTEPVTPGRILDLGLGFWGSKTLLSAIELGVFSELAQRPLDGEALRRRLGLAPRSARDFFDALVALGMLQRDGDQYSNTPETDLFLDRAKPSYIGGMLEMANARLYGFWGSLTDGLRTGQPQNEAKTAGDFFADPLPRADVLVMGHILHDWNLQEKRALLAKAYQALPRGGALIVYDQIIDEERRHNAAGLLMSLNMLIETPGGFDYTGAECCAWMTEAGFRETYVEHLAGPESMVGRAQVRV